MQGFVPGPLMVARAPELLYATIAGMLASTVFLLVVGWRMATLMLKAVLLNRQLVIVLALAMTILGTYALQNRVLDVAIAFVFGIIGYFMMRYGYSVAAAALAVFLGREFERNLRIGLNLTDGSIVQFSAGRSRYVRRHHDHPLCDRRLSPDQDAAAAESASRKFEPRSLRD